MMTTPAPITRLDAFTRTITLHSAQAPHQPRTHQLANAGARTLAALTDLALQAISFAIIAWGAHRLQPHLVPPHTWPWAIPAAFIEWHIIYLMFFESFTRGTTPGKTLAGLHVVRTDGQRAGSVPLVVRNVARVIDIALGAYTVAAGIITRSQRRQRLGDSLAGTIVIYAQPLSQQLQRAHTPASLYSTSEDGYLLEAWLQRETGFDAESHMLSSLDLAAYLYKKYEGDTPPPQVDPPTYLRQLYHHETGTAPGSEDGNETGSDPGSKTGSDPTGSSSGKENDIPAPGGE